MISNVLLGVCFLLMIIKPKFFVHISDDKTNALVCKIMRIGGIFGLICVGVSVFYILQIGKIA